MSVLKFRHYTLKLYNGNSIRVISMSLGDGKGGMGAGPAGPGSAPHPEGDEILAYVAPMLADLSHLAESGGYAHLAYLLDIARLEADSLQSDSKKPAA